jgi:hypothetical protein
MALPDVMEKGGGHGSRAQASITCDKSRLISVTLVGAGL